MSRSCTLGIRIAAGASAAPLDVSSPGSGGTTCRQRLNRRAILGLIFAQDSTPGYRRNGLQFIGTTGSIPPPGSRG
jgi:hypothetical protein